MRLPTFVRRTPLVVAAAAVLAFSGMQGDARGEAQPIVFSTDPAPGGGSDFFEFGTGLGAAINNAGQVAFASDFTDASGADGVFRATLSTLPVTPIERIVRTGDSTPSGVGTFRDNSSASINHAGTVAFYSTLLSAPTGAGIFLGNGTTRTEVMRQGQFAPGGDGRVDFLDYLGTGLALNPSGQVAFAATLYETDGGNADNEAIYRWDGPALPLVQIVREGDNAPGVGQFGGTTNHLTQMNDAGQVAFTVSITAGVDGFDNGVFIGNGVTITEVARRDGALPGGLPEAWANFGAPALNNAGQAAFHANYQNTNTGGVEDGIFRGNGTTITPIAKSGQPLPDASGFFGGFSERVDLNDAGQAAFVSTITPPSGFDVRTGLFRGDGTMGGLRIIAREGAPAPDGDGVISYIGLQGANTSLAGPFAADRLHRGDGRRSDQRVRGVQRVRPVLPRRRARLEQDHPRQRSVPRQHGDRFRLRRLPPGRTIRVERPGPSGVHIQAGGRTHWPGGVVDPRAVVARRRGAGGNRDASSPASGLRITAAKNSPPPWRPADVRCMALVAKPVYQQVAPTPHVVDEAALAAFGCDVSFISDDSMAAEELVTRAVEHATSQDVKHLLWEIFDRLRADYEANSPILHPTGVMTRIGQARATLGFEPGAEQRGTLLRFFNDVNQVLFQHQTLAWLAGDANFKLHLYGRGWESHPTLARYARGAVRDDAMRQAIVRASKITLSAAPYGAVTPAVLEGVRAGGFFLMRFCAADVIERFYPPLIDFCAREHLHTNAALAEAATPGVRELLAFASRTLGVDVLTEWPDFVPYLLSLRAQPRSRSAAVLWPEHYGQVCFSSRDELLNLAGKFLYDQPQRRALAEAMRRQLIHPAPPRLSVQVSRAGAPRTRRGEVAA